MRLERARYDARLAERRYKAIDPDHRVVARTLEREWNDALADLEHLEREYHDVRRRERIVALATDLPAVWHGRWGRASPRASMGSSSPLALLSNFGGGDW